MTTVPARRLLPDNSPRWVIERPRTLEDCWLYALEGDYTVEDSGSPRRWPHVVWVWAVTLPLFAVAHAILWTAERPGRLLPLLLVGSLLSSALNAWSATEWLVPDWWTIPYWVSTVTGWWAA